MKWICTQLMREVESALDTTEERVATPTTLLHPQEDRYTGFSLIANVEAAIRLRRSQTTEDGR